MPTATTERVWSPEQEAIFARLSRRDKAQPHTIVRARAGTGKTTTIVEALGRAGWSASTLLAAFNKRIQVELARRVPAGVDVKTLHSLGYQLVREHWPGIKVHEKKPRQPTRASVLTDAAERVMADTGELACAGYGYLTGKLHTQARELCPLDPNESALLALLEDFDDELPKKHEALLAIVRIAQKAVELSTDEDLARSTGIDFADMIGVPLRAGWTSPIYDLVMVDEAQDMSGPQLDLAQRMCKGSMVLVGDDRQAIYGFRGADSGALDRLKLALQAQEFPLCQTFRCGHAIVKHAATLVSDFVAADSNPPGEIATVSWRDMIESVEPGDFVLSRTNAPLVPIALACLRQGVPAVIAGRDVGQSLLTIHKKIARTTFSMRDWHTDLGRWEQREAASANERGLENRVTRIHDQADTLRALAADANAVAEIEHRLNQLYSDASERGHVVCSTIHKAKGLEATTVYVLRQTLYPKWAMNDPVQAREEKNLEYVAVTRAKERLVWVGDMQEIRR